MALKRNPAWIADLEDRELFISFAEDPKIGLMGLFGDDWHTAGIETDEGTFSLTREVTESTTAGAGYGVVSRSYKPGAVTSTVDLLEDNEIVDHIQWPDTAVSPDGVRGRRHSSKVAKAHVARVHVKNDGTVEISVTREKAFLTIPERARADAAAGKTLNVAYVPDAEKFIFEDRFFKIEGGEVVEFTPKRFVADAEIVSDDKIQIGGEGVTPSEIVSEVVDTDPS